MSTVGRDSIAGAGMRNPAAAERRWLSSLGFWSLCSLYHQGSPPGLDLSLRPAPARHLAPPPRRPASAPPSSGGLAPCLPAVHVGAVSFGNAGPRAAPGRCREGAVAAACARSPPRPRPWRVPATTKGWASSSRRCGTGTAAGRGGESVRHWELWVPCLAFLPIPRQWFPRPGTRLRPTTSSEWGPEHKVHHKWPYVWVRCRERL